MHTISIPSTAKNTYQGPTFELVEQIEWDEFKRSGTHFSSRKRPLLVRGALKHWPASERWTFERIAELQRRDGAEVRTKFQIGVEQGPTADGTAPVKPYLLELARTQHEARAAGHHLGGLLPAQRLAQLKPGEHFHIDWSYMKSTAEVTQPYLSLWDMLDEFPELKRDLRLGELWPGVRWDWSYSFLGPAHSVSGIHFDYPNNLFCQFSGVKEFMLFESDQDPHMCASSKYDWGSKLSHIDITRLDEQPEQAAHFARAHGVYARLEAGDALYVPHRVWHCVVSLLPSVSLAVFGLTPYELLVDGAPSVFRAAAHALGLYGRGNCTCHGAGSGY
ncbi:MAG: cupin-like protein [Myxococcaceae bacterium]|nr:cupin-like protein [Myxococcaceae bacterium]